MQIIRKLSQDQLVRHNVVFFLGSLAVAVANYAFHPAISRLLSVEEFGEVTATLSLFAQVGVVLGIFNMLSIHIASNRARYGERPMLEEVYTLVFALQSVCALGVLIAAPWLMVHMQFVSVVPFILLALSMFISSPYTYQSSRMQAGKRFGRLSLASLMQSVAKLVLSVSLVSLGFGVGGALGGIIMAQLVALFYILDRKVSLRDILPRRMPRFDAALRSELTYGALILLSTGLVTLLYTADTIVAKYFFSPEVAGQYAAIAVIARIIFFATASISGVLLPSVNLLQTKQENYRVLVRSIALVLLIGGSGVFLMMLFPTFIITLLLGSKYAMFSSLLPELSLFILLASLVNLLVFFLIALRRFVLIPIALCGMILLLALVSASHDSVGTVIHQFTLTNGVVLALLSSYVIYDHTRTKKDALDHHSSL